MTASQTAQRITVTIDADTLASLDALAARLGGASRAAAARYALGLGLDTAARPEPQDAAPGVPPTIRRRPRHPLF